MKFFLNIYNKKKQIICLRTEQKQDNAQNKHVLFVQHQQKCETQKTSIRAGVGIESRHEGRAWGKADMRVGVGVESRHEAGVGVESRHKQHEKNSKSQEEVHSFLHKKTKTNIRNW